MSTKPTVSVVTCHNQLFPLHVADLRVLQEHGFTATRISEHVLDVLLQTVLKGLRFQRHEWSEIYESLLSYFQQKVGEDMPEVSFRVGEDHLLALIATEDADALLTMGKPGTAKQKRTEAAPEEHPSVTKFLKHCDSLRKYLGQYSHRLQVHRREKPGYGVLFRLTAEYVEAMPNGLFYAINLQQPEALCLNLGTCFRLRFAMEKLGEQPTFTVYSEDRINGEWVSNLRRGFHKSQIDTQNVRELATFLLTHFN